MTRLVAAIERTRKLPFAHTVAFRDLGSTCEFIQNHERLAVGTFKPSPKLGLTSGNAGFSDDIYQI